MKMCYYVLERLDVEKMEVIVEKGVLNVNAESVHDMLGLPLGGTLFKDMPVFDEDSCMFEWKNQYENTKDLRLKQLKNEILLTGDFIDEKTIENTKDLRLKQSECTTTYKERHRY